MADSYTSDLCGNKTLDSYGSSGKQGTLSAGTTSSLQGTLYNSGSSTTGKGTTNGSVTKTVTTTDTRPQINVSGTWKKVNAVKVNVGGTWKSVSVTNTSSTTYTK